MKKVLVFSLFCSLFFTTVSYAQKVKPVNYGRFGEPDGSERAW